MPLGGQGQRRYQVKTAKDQRVLQESIRGTEEPGIEPSFPATFQTRETARSSPSMDNRTE